MNRPASDRARPAALAPRPAQANPIHPSTLTPAFPTPSPNPCIQNDLHRSPQTPPSKTQHNPAPRRSSFFILHSSLTLALLYSSLIIHHSSFGATRPTTRPLTQLLAEVPRYRAGDDRISLDQLADRVIQSRSTPEVRADLAARLAALLSAAATPDSKHFILRQLSLIALDAQVPAIARLLTDLDKDLADAARATLESLATPAADAALRSALSSAPPALRIGIINSLGNRRDAAAIPALRNLLDAPDPDTAIAAARALGRVAGQPAIAALDAALTAPAISPAPRDAIADALLSIADQLLLDGRHADADPIYRKLDASTFPAAIRFAALQGLAATDRPAATGRILQLLGSNDPSVIPAAAAIARQLGGPQATAALCNQLPRLSPLAQSLLLDALAARLDTTAAPAIRAALSSPDPSVRIAAIRALAALGDETDIPALVRTAAAEESDPQPARAAAAALARMRCTRADDALVKLLDRASTTAPAIATGPDLFRITLIRALGARSAASAIPLLQKLAEKDPADSIRIAALDALGAFGADRVLPSLVDRLVTARSAAERTAAQSAIFAAATRMNNREDVTGPMVKALEKAPESTRILLLATMSRIGGGRALDAVRSATTQPGPAAQQAALDAITHWPDAMAVKPLIEMAQAKDITRRQLAFRALLRLITLPPPRSPGEAATIYKQMLAAAADTSERLLVLSGLAEMKDAAAFDLLLPLLADIDTRTEAAAAILKIAAAVPAPQKPPARAVLQKLMESPGVSEAQRDQARALRESLR